MATTDIRPTITLACTVCKHRNYYQEEQAERPRPGRAEESTAAGAAAHRLPGALTRSCR